MSLLDFIFNSTGKSKRNSCTENIDGIFIMYRKHPFSKSIKITPKSNGDVLVTLPKNASFSYAKEFVFKNINWIKAELKSKIKLLPKIIEERRKLAKEILPKRLDELASKYGFKYGKVCIKNHRTIWGSCSFRNNINLNLHLVVLNDEFIDYVLLHELTHTVHKHHQKAFYALLTKNMPNALEIQRRLKKVKIGSSQ